MKFKLKTAGNFYHKKSERTALEKIGFNFKPSNYSGYVIEGEPEIEINTLEELIQFTNKYGEIIFESGSILIYDNYVE